MGPLHKSGVGRDWPVHPGSGAGLYAHTPLSQAGGAGTPRGTAPTLQEGQFREPRAGFAVPIDSLALFVCC
jgi:hypothetical protein